MEGDTWGCHPYFVVKYCTLYFMRIIKYTLRLYFVWFDFFEILKSLVVSISSLNAIRLVLSRCRDLPAPHHNVTSVSVSHCQHFLLVCAKRFERNENKI